MSQLKVKDAAPDVKQLFFTNLSSHWYLTLLLLRLMGETECPSITLLAIILCEHLLCICCSFMRSQVGNFEIILTVLSPGSRLDPSLEDLHLMSLTVDRVNAGKGKIVKPEVR